MGIQPSAQADPVHQAVSYTHLDVYKRQPYIRPQECGNRTDVRWLEATDEAGRGVRVERVDAPLQVSAIPYTAQELDSAFHPDELPPVHYTVLDVAGFRMGVGGDDSWGAPVHDAYLIPSDKPLSFSFILRAI